MHWLLIRGLAREQRHWENFPEVFAEIAPGDKVFCLDLPAMGTESHRESPASIAGIVDDLRRRWIHLKTKTHDPQAKWGLMAISLGGMVGIQWAASYPLDFGRLVVMNSSTAHLNPFYERLRWESWPRFFEAFLAADARKREETVLKMTSNLLPDKVFSEVASRWARYSEEHPISRTAVLRQLKAAYGFVLPKKMAVPLLIMGSRADRLVHPRCSERLADFYSAHSVFHPEAGHDLSLDAPEWTANQIMKWSSEEARR